MMLEIKFFERGLELKNVCVLDKKNKRELPPSKCQGVVVNVLYQAWSERKSQKPSKRVQLTAQRWIYYNSVLTALPSF